MKELEQVNYNIKIINLIFLLLIYKILVIIFFNIMFQDPFDPEEFVERLAWRTLNDTIKDDGKIFFDPTIVHETFLQAIKDLQILQERQQKKCDKLETALKDEEAKHILEILELQERNKHSIDLFHQLDERINLVATKVLHLGDQLESVNTPRARAVEAQKLMRHFSDFLSPGPLTDPIFTDKSSVQISILYICDYIIYKIKIKMLYFIIAT